LRAFVFNWGHQLFSNARKQLPCRAPGTAKFVAVAHTT
jgi:hypothetical protein